MGPRIIQQQLADLPWHVIQSEAETRIARLRTGNWDQRQEAPSVERHIAGHAPTDGQKVGAAAGPCVKCGEEWPCEAITVPWAVTDYA